MPTVGFEPTISAGEWPQTYALDRAATGTGDSDFRGPDFKYRLKTQGSVTQDETLSLGKWLQTFRRDLETSS